MGCFSYTAVVLGVLLLAGLWWWLPVMFCVGWVLGYFWTDNG